MMDLVGKVRKVDALIADAKAEGEKRAAEFAKLCLEGELSGDLIEYTVRLRNVWTKKLFVAICHRYQLRTYRYAQQKRTTTMVSVSSAFLNGVLWPEFTKYDTIFQELAAEIIKELAAKICQFDGAEEEVIEGELPEAISSHEMVAL